MIALDPKSAEIIKPVLRGRDIKRYKVEFADLWLINAHNGYGRGESCVRPININDYPAIKKHLDHYWDKIKKRQDKGKTPYNLRNCAYLKEFEKEKIVWASVGVNEYSYVSKDFLLLDTNYFAVGLNKYHFAVLNSKLIIKKFIEETDTKVGIIAYRHYKYNFEKIPIPKISKSQQLPFEILVDGIIFAKENNLETEANLFEAIINGMVYGLYFEDEMKEAGCYIIDRVSEIIIKPFKTVKKLYELLINDEIICHGIADCDDIEVVQVINGL